MTYPSGTQQGTMEHPQEDGRTPDISAIAATAPPKYAEKHLDHENVREHTHQNAHCSLGGTDAEPPPRYA